jgi:FkbM family methyltransferase
MTNPNPATPDESSASDATTSATTSETPAESVSVHGMPDAAAAAPAESQVVDDFNRVVDTRYGRMMYNVNDVYIGRSLQEYGEAGEGEVEFFRQVVRPGDLVIDAGAAIGVHTVSLAKAVGPQGIVLAFEPQRLVFQTLCANVALNNLINVWTFQIALSDDAGAVRVPTLDPRRANNFGGLSLLNQTQGDGVSSFRLDTLPVPRCRMIKIDVEGMELQVLRGASAIIDRFKPVLYVKNDRRELSVELLKHITAIGYDAYWHLTPFYNPNNFRQNPTNVFGEVVSANMICVNRASNSNISGLQRVELPAEAM